VFVTLIVVAATPDATVTLTTPTTPFCIAEVSKPDSTQTYEPGFDAQVRDLPTAFALAPGAALIEATLAGEYVSVHCKPAGWLPAGEVRYRPNVAAPPTPSVPDDNANVPCAERRLADKSKRAAMESLGTSRFKARQQTSISTKRTSFFDTSPSLPATPQGDIIKI
jgi:hypothetical protein